MLCSGMMAAGMQLQKILEEEQSQLLIWVMCDHLGNGAIGCQKGGKSQACIEQSNV